MVLYLFTQKESLTDFSGLSSHYNLIARFSCTLGDIRSAARKGIRTFTFTYSCR